MYLGASTLSIFKASWSLSKLIWLMSTPMYLYIYLAETFPHMANSSRNSSTIWCKLITISSVLRASSLVSIGQVLVFLPLFNNRLRISYAHRSFALVSDFLLASRIRFISTIFDHVRGLGLLYAVLILSK